MNRLQKILTALHTVGLIVLTVSSSLEGVPKNVYNCKVYCPVEEGHKLFVDFAEAIPIHPSVAFEVGKRDFRPVDGIILITLEKRAN